MISTDRIRYDLGRLAEIAMELAETYGKGSEPLTPEQRAVMETLKLGQIKRLTEELKIFAYLGNHKEIDQFVREIHDWMEV